MSMTTSNTKHQRRRRDKRNPRPVQKITVQIWVGIPDKLEAKFDAACLRRDAYLQRLLETEVDWLNDEVSIPNSQAAHDYVVEQLQSLRRKPMSLALDPALVEQLNAVCASKRISRDAFFNRVFLLLAADPPLIDDLLFTDRSWRAEVWTENKHDGPFFQSAFYPLEPNTEPFWAIRNGLELRVGDLGTPEHWTEPCSGKSIRIHRTHGGDPMPLESLYSIVLDKKFRGEHCLASIHTCLTGSCQDFLPTSGTKLRLPTCWSVWGPLDAHQTRCTARSAARHPANGRSASRPLWSGRT